jgi:hypothetical protein
MIEILMKFLKFATFGMTCEIFFTALVEVKNSIKNKTKINWALKGFSFIWMFPIYGLVALLGPIIIEPAQQFPFIIRLLIYTSIIFIVEYITGWVIRKMTGRCPWHYDSGWQIHNLIRLDFTPFWMLFSALIEFLYFNY